MAVLSVTRDHTSEFIPVGASNITGNRQKAKSLNTTSESVYSIFTIFTVGRNFCDFQFVSKPGPEVIKQEGHEALNRSPEYTGQNSNI